MKGIICYYSGSGNTKLAVKYISKRIGNADFDLHNIVKTEIPDLSAYDIVGFATFTDFWGVPQYFHSFFEKIGPQPDKYAFVFNTFGFASGKTLHSLAGLASAKSFNVLAGYSLHTPENYPPMRTSNRAADDSPGPKELQKFDDFILRLDGMLETIRSGKAPKRQRMALGITGTFLPAFPRTRAKKDFGEQNVAEDLCDQCGICEKLCPYEAIELIPYPVFNHSKCNGCWSCYNHCPPKAIYTSKFKGEGQYPKPGKVFAAKLALK